MPIEHLLFSQIEINDAFFDSLKTDYAEFAAWFAKKSSERAYISRNDIGQIDGFLYLKVEVEAVADVEPPMQPSTRLKIGTMKIDAHGTKLGDRFAKKMFDNAMASKVSEIYVTIFPKHSSLINLLRRFGFKLHGKKTTPNGTESVFVRGLSWAGTSIIENYPLLSLTQGRKYLLALYPAWHTRLLPDSKLVNESPDIISDTSPTNSIRKVYIAGSEQAGSLVPGDILVIYRTSDNLGPAHYRAVATSLCAVEETRHINSFTSLQDFIDYCGPYSIFTDVELADFFKTRRLPFIIKFTYNVSLPKRVTRKTLIEGVGLNPNDRWSCVPLTEEQFQKICIEGKADAGFIVH